MADRSATAEAGELFAGIRAYVRAEFDPRLKQMSAYAGFLARELATQRKMISDLNQTIREQKKEIGTLNIQFERVNQRTLGKSGKPVKL